MSFVSFKTFYSKFRTHATIPDHTCFFHEKFQYPNFYFIDQTAITFFFWNHPSTLVHHIFQLWDLSRFYSYLSDFCCFPYNFFLAIFGFLNHFVFIQALNFRPFQFFSIKQNSSEIEFWRSAKLSSVYSLQIFG